MGRAHAAPVGAQLLQQPGREWHVAVLASLALLDPQEHAPGIDIGHAQARQFAAPKPGAVGGHQQGTVLGVRGDGEQPQQFVMIEDLGQGGGCLGAGQIEVRLGQPERDPVEKPDAVACAVAAFPGQPPLFVKVDEVVLDLLGRDAVGTAPVVTRQSGDGVEVRFLGVLGKSANGHVVEHALTKRCHVESPLVLEWIRRHRRVRPPVSASTILAGRERIGARCGSANREAGGTPQYFKGRTIAMCARRARRPAAERGSVHWGVQHQ